MMIFPMMMILVSCSEDLPGVEASTATLCDVTLDARQDHAAALEPLDGHDPLQRHAQQTGARALGSVAGGCGELS